MIHGKWAGAVVVAIGGGPSLSLEQIRKCWDARGKIKLIAINDAIILAPWADMLYAADESWWQHPDHRDAWAFAGLKVSVSAVAGVLRLRNTGVMGYDSDPQCLRTGGNSGYQALHIAAHAGAAKVLLCGYDMRGCHWHGRHPEGLRHTVPEVYVKWVDRFEKLAPALAKLGVDVVNTTPGSALKCFRRAALEDELAQSLEPASARAALSA
jgi:hypothetical protein